MAKKRPAIAKQIGAAMRTLRQRANLSQVEVAKRMELTEIGAVGLGRNERGVQVPRADTLQAFLKAVGADFTDLQHELEASEDRRSAKVSKRAERLARELSELAPPA